MNRRRFLRQGSIAGGAAVLGLKAFPHHLHAATREKTAQDVVTLGRTGIKVSRLFQGTGTNGVGKSSNQIRGLGFDGVVELLRAGVDQGITVTALPGPSAVILALSVSGLPTDRFVFEGLFPRKPGKAKRLVESWQDEARPIIFFESPQNGKRGIVLHHSRF